MSTITSQILTTRDLRVALACCVARRKKYANDLKYLQRRIDGAPDEQAACIFTALLNTQRGRHASMVDTIERLRAALTEMEKGPHT